MGGYIYADEAWPFKAATLYQLSSDVSRYLTMHSTSLNPSDTLSATFDYAHKSLATKVCPCQFLFGVSLPCFVFLRRQRGQYLN